jgi:hypothetical protein
MSDKQLPKELLEWREKNKKYLNESTVKMSLAELIQKHMTTMNNVEKIINEMRDKNEN